MNNLAGAIPRTPEQYFPITSIPCVSLDIAPSVQGVGILLGIPCDSGIGCPLRWIGSPPQVGNESDRLLMRTIMNQNANASQQTGPVGMPLVPSGLEDAFGQIAAAYEVSIRGIRRDCVEDGI